MSRAKYLFYRSVQTVILIWLAATATFLLMRLMPGSYTSQLIYAGATEAAIANIEEQWGLNDPLYMQYFNFLINLVTLDSGISLRFQQPVWEFVRLRMFNSFILVAPAILAAYIVGSVVGTIMGTRNNSAFEKYGVVPIVFVGALPSFVTSIFLIAIFSGNLGWFPSQGIVSTSIATEYQDTAWWRLYLTRNFAMHWILPFTAIFLRYLYLPTLMMRTNIVEILGQDFVKYYRMTGLPKLKRSRHLFKHASLPVITLFPISMIRAIAGVILVETVFNWPGLGYELFLAILNRDYPVLQFVFFLVAVFIIVSNFVVDILYGVIDPRVSVDE